MRETFAGNDRAKSSVRTICSLAWFQSNTVNKLTATPLCLLDGEGYLAPAKIHLATVLKSIFILKKGC